MERRFRLEAVFCGAPKQSLTFDVRGRRIGEAAKGTHKRSLWAVPLDGIVRPRARLTHDGLYAEQHL
jgi:hypothetical protein